ASRQRYTTATINQSAKLKDWTHQLRLPSSPNDPSPAVVVAVAPDPSSGFASSVICGNATAQTAGANVARRIVALSFIALFVIRSDVDASCKQRTDELSTRNDPRKKAPNKTSTISMKTLDFVAVARLLGRAGEL